MPSSIDKYHKTTHSQKNRGVNDKRLKNLGDRWDLFKKGRSDMYDGFINAAKEVFGTKITIIIDRFHVAKNDRGAIETLRKKAILLGTVFA